MERSDVNEAGNADETETRTDSQPQPDVKATSAVGSVAVGAEALELREFFERHWGDMAFGD